MPLSRRTFLVGAAVWAGIGAHAWWHRSTEGHGGLRLCSWNLRNFSGRREATSRHAPGHDLERLATQLASIDADLFCFQEVLAPEALRSLLPGYALAVSTTGGAHGQHLVIARRASMTAAAARTDPCTAVTPRLRPVLEQRVTMPGGEVSVLVVHLKAGRQGFDVRLAQRRALLRLLDTLPRPRLVVGDFNTTGSNTIAADREIASLSADFEALDLHRVVPTLPCSAYWEGGRYDGYEEASTLDHVFIDRAPPLAPAVQVAPGMHCARHRCRPLRSTEAYPDLDYERVSDHCPMIIDVSA